ncbi:hypothetical protein L1987_38823 [Smallanthus sonchifolius]|uniref:Uncharacterized protein n=1 Tax=Smallanthus sonchifolius TaxID=185202 RepID=A0ACB9HLF9_9ASTR|nr:hypothetical protein L1987_38823 [Smallanthus sonchifolius]
MRYCCYCLSYKVEPRVLTHVIFSSLLLVFVSSDLHVCWFRASQFVPAPLEKKTGVTTSAMSSTFVWPYFSGDLVIFIVLSKAKVNSR